MYLNHFGLDEAPFSITPDPTFIYLSQRHRDALAHLIYGVGQGGSGGFVQLTGEVGTGKTTLCRALLEQVPSGTHIALVLNPLLNPVEMLAAICEELGLDPAGAEHSPKALVDLLTAYLLERYQLGERVVLVIDEAQNLSQESLEQVRLLTNLETHKQKLLQIILLGQPELREMLRRRSLRQLAQRITARYHLTPLSAEDTSRYINHRLQVAGAQRNPFTRNGLKALFKRSLGVPRLINIIADRAMAGAYARDTHDIDAKLVNAAADEIQLGEPGVHHIPWARYALASALVAALLGAGWWLGKRTFSPEIPAVATSQPASVQPSGEEQKPPPPDSVSQAETLAEVTPASDPLPAVDAFWMEQQHLRAWQGLGAEWGRAGDAALIEATCLGSERLGFACLRDQGNWSRIQQLGLPVILVLQGEQPGYLLLRGINGSRLMVGAPGDARDVDRLQIEQQWLGDYLVAWPQSVDWPREIGLGDEGAAVTTVLELSRRADQPFEGPAQFNADFERWLIDFQLRHSLYPDGIVGPKTLLYLMRFSIEQPQLLSQWEPGV